MGKKLEVFLKGLGSSYAPLPSEPEHVFAHS